MEERYDPMEWKYDRMEWKYDRMEERYDRMEWKYDRTELKYDRMEERYDPMEPGYDPMECKSRLDCIFVQNAPPYRRLCGGVGENPIMKGQGCIVILFGLQIAYFGDT